MTKRSTDNQKNLPEISNLGKLVAEYRGSINTIVKGIVLILIGVYAAVVLVAEPPQDTRQRLILLAFTIGSPIIGVSFMRGFKKRIVVYSEGFAIITPKETKAIRWEEMAKVEATATYQASRKTPVPVFYIKLNNGHTIPITEELDNYVQLGNHIHQEFMKRALFKAAHEVAQKSAAASNRSTSPKTTSAPEFSEEQAKATIDAKIALRAYWRNQAERWWEDNPDRERDAVCDVCNSPITPADSFYFVEGNRMKCKSCTESSLKSWEESGKSNTYFGRAEYSSAMEYYMSMSHQQ